MEFEHVVSLPSEPDARIPVNYRTLFTQPDEKTPDKNTIETSDMLRQIDVHTIDTEQVFHRYSTHPELGLDQTAVDRKAKDGKNIISPPPTQYWKKVMNYIFGGFNFLMWIAFIVTLLSYKPLNGTPAAFILGVAVLLMLVIIISATFYAVVDWNASRVMKSVKSLIADKAIVIRDGRQESIPAAHIVVGDLVILSMGDRVPADMRIVKMSSDLKFDRSLLTGESDPIPGSLHATAQHALEAHNLALASTFLVQGKCTGVVFAIGDTTIMGRIVAMSGETKFKMTTIQREIWFFTKIISAAALSLFAISIIVWGAWLRKTYPVYESASGAIINSIGCITAFVPQGLPICVALSLTIIAKRMAKHNVLVKNLATIETLGCMSVLCSDKTGTLTVGKMSLESVAFLDRQFLDIKSSLAHPSEHTPPSLKSLIEIARLCNGAVYVDANEFAPTEHSIIRGDATDTAILRFTESFTRKNSGIDVPSIVASHEKLFEIPFNPRNRWMLTLVREQLDLCEEYNEAEPVMFVKGAPDVLFPACNDALKADGSSIPFDNDILWQVSVLQSEWSSQGQRVLALCKKSLDGLKIDTNTPASDIEEMMYAELNDLTLVGLVGIRDPPRDDVKTAIKRIRKAGCRVFMVTGDYQLTGVAIAKQVGILTNEHIASLKEMRSSAFAFIATPNELIKPPEDGVERSIALTGDDISSFDREDWNMVIGNYTEVVFARTTPEQKLRIIEEIKLRGDNIVAVTGDGVNDAPALKASDIGVAMGSGSDVAKEAAAMILMDNKFSSIPVAIELGRLVFDNLKKVALYLMPAGTYAEFLPVFCNVFLGMQLALSSYLQVCFSLTNDVVMSISLMYEQPEIDLMQNKPRNARTGRLTDWRFFVQIYLFIGLMMWPCAMSMWFLYMRQQGLTFYDVILVYEKWTNGYKGYTKAQLTHFVYVGQCVYYVSIVFMQYGGLLSVRNRRVSILQSNPLWGPRRNYAVPLGMIATMLIAVVNLYGPGLRHVFDTAPIPGMFWGLPLTFALGILCMDELRKLIVRTYPKSIIAKMAW